MAIFSLIFLILILPLTLLFILKKTKPKSAPNLPPGPTPLPLLGNIHQIGKRPHVSFAQFSNKYGPLITVRLGTQLAIIATSPASAIEILKTNDRQLCSRYVPRAFRSHDLHLSLLWATDCTTTAPWRSQRNLLRTEVFSSRALESQTVMREEKVGEMVDYLKSKEGQVVMISEVIFATVFNTLANIIYSKDFLELEGDSIEAVELKKALNDMLATGGIPNIGDFYPSLDKFDLQGLKTKTTNITSQLFSKWEVLINERRSANKSPSGKQDLMDCMIGQGFSNGQINLLSIELFTAGTDTTTSTVEWAMAELLKKKEAMDKIREEIRNVIGTDSMIKESQASQLPYLSACIKETMRLHPPAPFLLPHQANETCHVMNYTIPKDSQVMVNIWAIGRDPSIWEDPLCFKPERFLDSNLDYKGFDFEYIPFGSGRRICPGMPSAVKQLPFILASLIHHFDWILPGNKDPQQLDMTDKFGTTLQKEQPLKLIFKNRFGGGRAKHMGQLPPLSFKNPTI